MPPTARRSTSSYRPKRMGKLSANVGNSTATVRASPAPGGASRNPCSASGTPAHQLDPGALQSPRHAAVEPLAGDHADAPGLAGLDPGLGDLGVGPGQRDLDRAHPGLVEEPPDRVEHD